MALPQTSQESDQVSFSPLAWYHIQTKIPDTWEITHYSINEVEGRLDFCNRQWHQGRFSWKKGKVYKKPDLDRTLNEFYKRHLLEHHKDEASSFKSMSTRQIGPFLFAYDKDDRPCQAAYYLDEEMTILIWTFPSFSQSFLHDTITPILEKFQSNEVEPRKWSAFGLSFSLPREFDLEDASILPGDVCLNFEHTNRQQVNVHRWALPGELLRGQDLKKFYYRVLGGRKDKVMTMEDCSYRGMDSVTVTFERTGNHAMDKLYGRAWQGVGRVWYDREEQRIYAYEQAGPKKISHLDEQKILSC